MGSRDETCAAGSDGDAALSECFFCGWLVLYLLTRQGRIKVYECERCGTCFDIRDGDRADLGVGVSENEREEIEQ